jgi:hypothetical protein
VLNRCISRSEMTEVEVAMGYMLQQARLSKKKLQGLSSDFVYEARQCRSIGVRFGQGATELKRVTCCTEPYTKQASGLPVKLTTSCGQDGPTMRHVRRRMNSIPAHIT